jgi:hypothetical protein
MIAIVQQPVAQIVSHYIAQKISHIGVN